MPVEVQHSSTALYIYFYIYIILYMMYYIYIYYIVYDVSWLQHWKIQQTHQRAQCRYGEHWGIIRSLPDLLMARGVGSATGAS